MPSSGVNVYFANGQTDRTLVPYTVWWHSKKVLHVRTPHTPHSWMNN
jgi:hypothetical protein